MEKEKETIKINGCWLVPYPPTERLDQEIITRGPLRYRWLTPAEAQKFKYSAALDEALIQMPGDAVIVYQTENGMVIFRFNEGKADVRVTRESEAPLNAYALMRCLNCRKNQ